MKVDKIKQNYKIIRAVHLIVIAVCGLALLFLESNLWSILTTFLLIFAISLIVQMLVFYIKPGFFSDKIKVYPDEN